MKLNLMKFAFMLCLVFSSIVTVSAQQGQKLGNFILTGVWEGYGNENTTNLPASNNYGIGKFGEEYEYGYDGFQYVIPNADGSTYSKVILTNEEALPNGLYRFHTSAFISASGNQFNGYAIQKVPSPGVLQVWLYMSFNNQPYLFVFAYKETI
jgi:hypothetical protein